MYANYAIWESGLGEPKNDFLQMGGIPNGKGLIFRRGVDTQCNIEMENVALWCGCGVLAAECLDSSAVATVGIAC